MLACPYSLVVWALRRHVQ